MSRHVEIELPTYGSAIPKESLIWGKVKHHHPGVQIYVLANDGLWYLQRPVKFLGGKYKNRVWAGICFLGEDGSPIGSSYKIAAIVSDERPETPVGELPGTPHSHIIDVVTCESGELTAIHDKDLHSALHAAWPEHV